MYHLSSFFGNLVVANGSSDSLKKGKSATKVLSSSKGIPVKESPVTPESPRSPRNIAQETPAPTSELTSQIRYDNDEIVKFIPRSFDAFPPHIQAKIKAQGIEPTVKKTTCLI